MHSWPRKNQRIRDAECESCCPRLNQPGEATPVAKSVFRLGDIPGFELGVENERGMEGV